MCLWNAIINIATSSSTLGCHDMAGITCVCESVCEVLSTNTQQDVLDVHCRDGVDQDSVQTLKKNLYRPFLELVINLYVIG